MDLLVLHKRACSALMLIGVAAVALTLAGCSDEEESAAAAAHRLRGSGNRSPTISGTPLASVMEGTAYSFAPHATDADGNTLTFSVESTPPWAAFNSSTGQLSGTPTPAQVGTYSNIRIGVSDGTATVNLPAFSITVVATATGSVTLAWNPPTQNTDGSPLTDLSGYRVYWGTSHGSYTSSATITNPGLSSYVVEQLTPATWFFALTALNSAGAESDYSDIASRQVL